MSQWVQRLINMVKTISCLVGCAVVTSHLVSCGALSSSVKAISYNLEQREKEAAEAKVVVSGAKLADGDSAVSEYIPDDKGLAELPKENEIIWAPEDPSKAIPGFSGGVISAEDSLDPWLRDYKIAMQVSRQQGKAVMVWFTNSRSSPLCEVLKRELLTTDNFLEWAEENVVLLKIDSTIEESKMNDRIERQKKVDALKSRYRVMGNPEMIVLSPRGTIFGKYRGYKRGRSDYYFGKLRNATRKAMTDYSDWRREMNKKGYRVWHDLQKRSVYAKVSRYRKGKIWLVEPDGRKSAIKIMKLSLEDQKYIESKVAASKARKQRRR